MNELNNKILQAIEKHLHDEATAIETEGIEKMQNGAHRIAYDKLDLSKALRMAANYIGGVSA
tara:strand:- start:373 stop:558 length:186 start_codon:yes stop_codon:yes gene_type:complete